MKLSKSGRGWAYVGAMLGGLVSVAANVAHSYVPPAGALSDWSPETGAVVGAVFWPVAVFVAVEILARTAWPTGARWTAMRFLGLLPVALVAAVVSYRHLSGLLSHYGEDDLTAVIGPLAVDGLMVMATGALIATGARRAVAVAATVEPPAVEVPAPVAIPEPVSVVAEPVATLARGASRPPKRQPSAAERVARAIAKSPDATAAQIAARLKLSERTVQRHMRPKAVDSVSTATVPVLTAA
jgi:hypothetical protein